MKKLILTSLLCLGICGGFFANNPNKPKETEPKMTEAKAKTNVWAEQKFGTYRESTIISIFAGRCKRSTNQCMTIYHDGDNPNALRVTVNAASGEFSFDCKSYRERPYTDPKTGESGMEYVFD